jgi:hypothetical protein
VTNQLRMVPMALLCGLILAALFRLTDELVVMAEVLGLFALAGGALARRGAWVWGLGLGVGLLASTIVLGLWFPAQPWQQSPRELALYGPPRAVTNPLAEQAKIALAVTTFSVATSLVGWACRLGVERVFE